jgi:hypothetical protein
MALTNLGGPPPSLPDRRPLQLGLEPDHSVNDRGVAFCSSGWTDHQDVVSAGPTRSASARFAAGWLRTSCTPSGVPGPNWSLWGALVTGNQRAAYSAGLGSEFQNSWCPNRSPLRRHQRRQRGVRPVWFRCAALCDKTQADRRRCGMRGAPSKCLAPEGLTREAPARGWVVGES